MVPKRNIRMKRKLLVCGVIAGSITTVCGFLFGLSQPEKPFELTTMTWDQLESSIEKSKGADIEQFTLQYWPWISADQPDLEVQFREPRVKATISAKELKEERRTRCGLWPSPPAF